MGVVGFSVPSCFGRFLFATTRLHGTAVLNVDPTVDEEDRKDMAYRAALSATAIRRRTWLDRFDVCLDFTRVLSSLFVSYSPSLSCPYVFLCGCSLLSF